MTVRHHLVVAVLVVASALAMVSAGQAAVGLRYVCSYGGPGTGDGQFNGPWGMYLTSGHEVYVADANNHRVQNLTWDGGAYHFSRKFGTPGSGNGEFRTPIGIAMTVDQYLMVGEYVGDRLQVFDSLQLAVP